MSNHKQGCDALGGYGNGVGPCSCGQADDLIQRLANAGLVLMPAQLTNEELTKAQGALLDMNWDAVECFAARLAELYRVTRHRVEEAATLLEQQAAIAKATGATK